MGYLLKVKRYTSLRQNADGRILGKRRFVRGDDVSGLPERELERLIDLDAVVDEDEVEEAESEETPTEDPEEEPEGESTPETPEGQGTPETDQGDGTEEGGGEKPQSEDAPETYEEFEYADLQQEAKRRELNAGGSAADLRERLIAHDAGNSDD